MIIQNKNGKSAFDEYAKINPKPEIADKEKYISWRTACGKWARENGYLVFEVTDEETKPL